MAVSNLNFQGINRTVSDYGNAGACEEMINLRPTGTGLVPVKPFMAMMENITYDRVYVHKAGVVTNYIALKNESGTVKIYHIAEDGTIIQNGSDSSHPEIGSFSVSGKTHFSFSQVHFAYTGNIMLFSVCDKEDELFLNKAYLWTGISYKETEANIPQLTVSFSASNLTEAHWEGQAIPLNGDDISMSQWEEMAKAAQNALEEQDDDICFGPILIAIAFKTKDGNTFWTGQWYYFDPIPEDKSADLYIAQSDMPSEVQPYFPNGAFIFYSDSITSSPRKHEWSAAGVKVNMSISPISSSNWNEETSMLASVEVYTSRPVFYISEKARMIYPDIGTYDGIIGWHFAIPPIESHEQELDNQLMYFQTSIQIKELVDRQAAYTCSFKFGGNKQIANKTLEVDAGSVTRFGELLAYNARYHYYNSVAKTEIGGVQLYYERTSPTYTTDIFVRYNDGKGEDQMFYLGSESLPHVGWGAYVVIAPTIKVKEVITVADVSGTIYSRYYQMTESKKYNYSICVNGISKGGQGYPSDLADIKTAGVKNYAFSDEPDAINVTEQYNPFVFRVEHSYLAPSKVLDVQPQMVAVKDVTFGDYPLNVFTNRGLYALLQGNGTVLYGAFRPISNLVTTGNSVPTESGTFFIAAGSLWLIAGTQAVLISDALQLGPHKFIRSCPGYQAISLDAYDIEMYQSEVPFEEFVANARLSYNRFRDELIISNPEYLYSYVLSIKYKQWFKISMNLTQDVVGSDIATQNYATFKDIVNFSDEMEFDDEDDPIYALVHLQTRPFSVGYQYVHVHRVLAMIRAALGQFGKLIVALYGSDDLQNWKLLSYANRENVTISQIRTASAARSWRYYTICIGGATPVDTDFGTIMFEYEPVARRIG